MMRESVVMALCLSSTVKQWPIVACASYANEKPAATHNKVFLPWECDVMMHLSLSCLCQILMELFQEDQL